MLAMRHYHKEDLLRVALCLRQIWLDQTKHLFNPMNWVEVWILYTSTSISNSRTKTRQFIWLKHMLQLTMLTNMKMAIIMMVLNKKVKTNSALKVAQSKILTTTLLVKELVKEHMLWLELVCINFLIRKSQSKYTRNSNCLNLIEERV